MGPRLYRRSKENRDQQIRCPKDKVLSVQLSVRPSPGLSKTHYVGKRVNHRAVLPQIPTWMNQKGHQSGASFPATGPVYVTVATDTPCRKGSQIRKL